jgi:esterase/lipase superfamily enzyme
VYDESVFLSGVYDESVFLSEVYDESVFLSEVCDESEGDTFEDKIRVQTLVT